MPPTIEPPAAPPAAPAAQPPTPPPADPPATPAPTPTPEDAASKIRAAGKNAFFEGLLAQRKPPETKKEPDPEPTTPTATPEPPATPPATKDPATPPAAKKPITIRQKAPELDPKEAARIGAEAGAAAAMKVRETTPRAPAPRDEPVDFTKLDLPSDVAEDLETYVALQELNPKKYGSILKDFAEFNAKESTYIRKWEREHPGQAFDDKAADHDDFYADNRPEVPDVDMRKAQRAVVRREVQAELAPQLEKLERANRAKEVEPQVSALAGAAEKTVLAEGHPDFLDPKKIESDPLVKHIVTTVKRDVDTYVGSAVKLFNQAETYDDNNPVHREVFATIVDLQEKLLSYPPEDQRDENGRPFVPRLDYLKMTEAQQARCWTIQDNHVAAVLASRLTKTAKAHYEQGLKEREEWAARNGFVKPNASSGSPSATTPPADPNPPPPTPPPAQPPSPTVGSKPALPGKAAGSGGATTNWKQRFGTGG